MEDFFAAVAALSTEALASQAPNRAGWERVRDGLRQIEEPGDYAPRSFPVVESQLADAAALAVGQEARRLAQAALAIREALIWHASRNTYGEDPSLAHFYDNFAFSAVAGPPIRGYPIPCRSDGLMIGLTIQGPHTFYPAHAHQSVELYYLIGGSADWQQGDGVWRRVSSGAFIHHGPMEPHAMRTHDEPLLTFFAWVSDLDARPCLVEPPEAP